MQDSGSDRSYLRPLALVSGPAAAAAVARGDAAWLAGGPVAFSLVEVLARRLDRPDRVAREVLPVATLRARLDGAPGTLAPLFARLTSARAEWAGLALDRPRLMGVINVTPDSFSDGGAFLEPDAAVAQGRALSAAGADILDVGGESTRPGSNPVTVAEEIDRVLPVLRGLADDPAVRSIDSRNAAVLRAALDAGATIVNDVTALAGDPESLGVVAETGAAVVLMHMQGAPRTMQEDPRYACAPLDVYDFLADRMAACEAAGIPRARLAVDPGIGFGKTVAHNLELLAHLGLFHGLGCAVLLGASRKSFIAKLSRGEPADARLAGSLAAVAAGVEQGVQLFRVHDVAETAQALAISEAVAGRTGGGDGAGADFGLKRA